MKSNIKKFALALAFVGVISLVAGSLLLRQSVGNQGIGSRLQLDDERTFSSASITELSIKTVSSQVRWHEAAGDEIRVHLYGMASDNPPELLVNDSGSRIYIEVRHKPNMGFFHSEQTMLDVYIPKGLRLNSLAIESVSGDMSLADIEAANLTIRAVSGDVQAGNVRTDETRLNNTSGDYIINGLTGDLEYSSISGNLKLLYLEKANRINANSISGDISLDLPNDAGFSIRADTVSGDVSCDFPLTVTGKLGNRGLSGTVGDGSMSIDIRTISGNQRVF